MHSKVFSVVALLSAAAFAAPHGTPAEPEPFVLDTSCGNEEGIDFAIFDYATPMGAKSAKDWNPDMMNVGNPANHTGTRNRIGVLTASAKGGDKTPNWVSIYGSPGPINTNHMGIRHTGYFLATLNGTYTVNTKSDDGSYIFLGGECCGETAKSHGYDSKMFIDINGGSKAIKNVQAGYYVPFDLRCANIYGGPYSCTFTITDPKGGVLLNYGKNSTNVVNQVCDSRKIWQCPDMAQN